MLKDGKEVAVKVQHKTVKKNAFRDAKVIEVSFSTTKSCFVSTSRKCGMEYLYDFERGSAKPGSDLL